MESGGDKDSQLVSLRKQGILYLISNFRDEDFHQFIVASRV